MRPHLILVHDQEQLEAIAGPAVPSDAPPATVPQEARMPGSGRRNWVYREIAQLGDEAAPWVEGDG